MASSRGLRRVPRVDYAALESGLSPSPEVPISGDHDLLNTTLPLPRHGQDDHFLVSPCRNNDDVRSALAAAKAVHERLSQALEL